MLTPLFGRQLKGRTEGGMVHEHGPCSPAGYTVGGMLHLVLNNQVGFTTAPRDGRSSVHATCAGKAIGAPILHVNADDPEAVVTACEIAADFRHRWRKDVIVDVIGYRRYH